jgi:hypothetical protein
LLRKWKCRIRVEDFRTAVELANSTQLERASGTGYDLAVILLPGIALFLGGSLFVASPAVVCALDVWGVLHVAGAVSGESIDPSQKARTLAEGISEVMNLTALFGLVYLACVVALLAATWRWHWSAKAPKPANEPPYR